MVVVGCMVRGMGRGLVLVLGCGGCGGVVDNGLRRSLRREGVGVVFGGAAGLYPGMLEVVVPFCCCCCCCENTCVGLPPGTGGGGLNASANEPLGSFTLLVLILVFTLGSSPVSKST